MIAEKIVHPEAQKPDKFQSTKPWRARVFQFAVYGAILGTLVFGLVGFFITKGSVDVPLAEPTRSTGWPFIFTLSFAGFIAMAVLGGLVALYTRDIKSSSGKKGA